MTANISRNTLAVSQFLPFSPLGVARAHNLLDRSGCAVKARYRMLQDSGLKSRRMSDYIYDAIRVNSRTVRKEKEKITVALHYGDITM